MSKVPNGSNFDKSDLDWGYFDPQPVEPAIYEMPSQLSGERFDQPQRKTYIFINGCLNFSVFHQQRLIVAEVDVSADNSEYADLLLSQLRTRLRNQKWTSCQVQGPFIPYEHGISIATLLIQVGLDSNFDEVYRVARLFLELHPDNDQVERFKKAWATPEHRPGHAGIRESQCGWTIEELQAIESLTPLTP
jgi:hypothetical protein